MKRTTWLVVFALVTLVIAAWLFDTIRDAGGFSTIDPHGPPTNHIVSGFRGGSEDVVFRSNQTELFVSSANFRDPTTPGGIYLIDTTAALPAATDVTPKLDFPFQPHGIDLWVAPDGKERLFVVNHGVGTGFTQGTETHEASHTVEIFDVAPNGGLSHVRTIADDMLITPNDVAAVGAEQFYATNDHGYASGVMRMFEDWLRLPLGSVVYFDGTKFSEVLDGLRFPNGVAVSHDSREVYVAETTGGFLRVLTRDTADGSLEQTWQSEAMTGLDNIDIAPDGSLWVGAHPNLLAFLGHASDSATPSPSQVLHFVRNNTEWSVDEVWLDAGETLSGSSVAASNGSLIAVGAVFENKLILLQAHEREAAPSAKARDEE